MPYAASLRFAANPITGYPICEIRGQLTTKPRLLEVAVEYIAFAGTPISVGIGRPAAVGVTPKDAATFTSTSDTTESSRTTICSVWATPPTVPANFFRRSISAGTQGHGIAWTFPRGLGIAPNGSIVIWAIAGVATGDLDAVIDE